MLKLFLIVFLLFVSFSMKATNAITTDEWCGQLFSSKNMQVTQDVMSFLGTFHEYLALLARVDGTEITQEDQEAINSLKEKLHSMGNSINSDPENAEMTKYFLSFFDNEPQSQEEMNSKVLITQRCHECSQRIIKNHEKRTQECIAIVKPRIFAPAEEFCRGIFQHRI